MTHLDRRHFLAATTAATAMGISAKSLSAADESTGGDREFYELRKITLDTDAQREGFDRFMAEAAVPALNRMGVEPVGVFHVVDGDRPAYMLTRHTSLDSVATMIASMGSDAEFQEAGEAFIDATAQTPAYGRMTTSLLTAFKGMPKLETPVTSPGRVLQLRIYESHSVAANQKKIEMFNDAGEISIFREAGLHPVFFGEAIAGPQLPNLTYMLAFESEEEQQANWQTFINHPDWKRISAMPEYANDRIISNITNLILRPADCSQI
jgi:hypothetical protein